MKTSAALLSFAALSAAVALEPRASSLPAVTVSGNGEPTDILSPSDLY